MRSKTKNRTEAILLRMSKEEKQQLIMLAKEQIMSLSDYLRFVGLKAKVQVILQYQKEDI